MTSIPRNPDLSDDKFIFYLAKADQFATQPPFPDVVYCVFIPDPLPGSADDGHYLSVRKCDSLMFVSITWFPANTLAVMRVPNDKEGDIIDLLTEAANFFLKKSPTTGSEQYRCKLQVLLAFCNEHKKLSPVDFEDRFMEWASKNQEIS
jgi:hypothetical protein